MTTDAAVDVTAEYGPADIVGEGRLRLLDYPNADDVMPVEQFDLPTTTYRDATAVRIESRRRHRNVGAIYDSTGAVVSSTERSKPRQGWYPTPATLPDPDATPAQVLEGRTFFGGLYVRHFGHILLETMTRFWEDQDYSAYDHILFLPKFVDSSWSGVPTGLFHFMTGLAGVSPEQIHVATDRVRCAEIDVPGRAFRVATAADPRFLHIYDRIGDAAEAAADRPATDYPKRVYLSRSMLDKKRAKGQRTADNEPAVEDLVRAAGFEIVHPQTLPFPEQARLMRHADVIAGCDGSALHLAMFARPGTALLSLDSRAVANQFMIDRARGLDAVHLWAATEATSRLVSSWSIDLPRVQAALDLTLEG